MPTGAGEKRVIQSLERSVQILDYLAENPGGARLSVISRNLGLNKSTAFSLISSMKELRLVRQDEDSGKYALGVRLLQYGYCVEKSMDIISIAQPQLNHLAEQYEETAHMAVLSGSNIIYLAKAESAKTIHMTTRIGSVMPAYCSSLGKMLLSQLPNNKLFAVLSEIEFVQRTSNTILTPERLLDELDLARKEHCAFDREECDLGVFCVSSAVYNAQNECVAAISISVSIGKASLIGEDAMKASVISAAENISKRLGCTLFS